MKSRTPRNAVVDSRKQAVKARERSLRQKVVDIHSGWSLASPSTRGRQTS